jgi:Fe2+ or Zn2+ uptake regulation protein
MATSQELLRSRGLKDTLPRRAVLQILDSAKNPLSIQDIHVHLTKQKQSIGVVTIYRVIEALSKAGLVHRHPLEGTLSGCTLPDVSGHHVLLHCASCGTVREVHDHELCKRENQLAKQLGFTPSHHVSELIGTCSSCS